MKKIFLLASLSISVLTYSQNSNKDLNEKIQQLKPGIDSNIALLDSLAKERERKFDSANMAQFNEQNTRNLNSFMNGMREREKEQKKRMWMRLSFGVVLLGVGAYSIFRRKKKKI